MKSKIFAILMMMFTIIACNNRIDENIPIVNIDINNLCDAESIFDNYHYIALETNEKCILSEICKLEVDKEFIYVLDNRHTEIHIYDLGGKFINKIHKKGRSREEYISITDFNIYDNKVYLLSRAEKKINVYNASDCNYIHTIQLNDWYNNFIIVDDVIYLYSERSNNQGKDFIVYDMIKEKHINDFDSFVINESYGFATSPFNSSDSRLFVTKPFDHRVYELTKGSFSPYYVFNFNTHITPQVNESTKYSELADQLRYKSVVKRILHISQSGDNIIIITKLFLDGKGDRSLLSVVNSDGTVKSYCYGDAISDKFPYLSTPIYMKDGIVISATPAATILNNEKRSDRIFLSPNGLSEDDNPILFFTKVRLSN